ncbi:hypothetical protein D0Z03_001827 [Geotrichum reessii]|nr:hypothetical protein D0Z03_001827 [Galactomyces reessii]
MPNLLQIFGKSSETLVFALSDKAFIGDKFLNTNYTYQNAFLDQLNGQYTVKPTEVDYKVNLDLSVSKNGLFLIGSGGNNDSTLTAICNAIRHNISFQNKNDPHEPKVFGSDIDAVFMKLGINFEGKHVYTSFKKFASTLSLYDFVIGG